MSANEVTVLLIKPGQPPRLESLPTAGLFTRCQKLVGGYIETLWIANRVPGWDLTAYVNEDGIGLNEPLCCFIKGTPLFGTVVVVRESVDEDGVTHYDDLQPADVDFIKENMS